MPKTQPHGAPVKPPRRPPAKPRDRPQVARKSTSGPVAVGSAAGASRAKPSPLRMPSPGGPTFPAVRRPAPPPSPMSLPGAANVPPAAVPGFPPVSPGIVPAPRIPTGLPVGLQVVHSLPLTPANLDYSQPFILGASSRRPANLAASKCGYRGVVYRAGLLPYAQGADRFCAPNRATFGIDVFDPHSGRIVTEYRCRLHPGFLTYDRNESSRHGNGCNKVRSSCPYCHKEMRSDNIARHVASKHPHGK